jgi:glucokinase
MILAGDIGGTHARLAFFDAANGQFNLVSTSTYPTHKYASLDQIVAEFVDTAKLHPDAACFGVAGPVSNGRVQTTNLPWIIESKRLADELKIKQAMLINDLEATAWGVPALAASDLVALNQVPGIPFGTQAVIAAGTGLGEAGMYWDGAQHHVFACEGGHSDFAARDDLEVDLFRYLHKLYGHVSYERILSGPGLVNVFHFLRDTGRGTEPQWLTDEMHATDPAAAISRSALAGTSPLSEQALAIFISVYGAETGNLALKTKATGGVYIAGGIAPKILPKLAGPQFMQAFVSKGRMQSLLESIPVRVAVNDQTALLGAARCAAMKSAA